jgi:23S rRNA (guanosine2251-2'-O)-methyltransferase
MVERSRRGKGKKKLLGSHQRCWLWGRNLVRETLLAGRWPIVELFVADDLPRTDVEAVRAATARGGFELTVVPRERLERLAHTSEHQGHLAKMGPFPYAKSGELIEGASSRSLFLVLDAIQDPYNFGAMLRSAGAFGVDGVFVGKRRQVPVTSMVARSSVGVVNRVPICRVDDLALHVRTLRARGVRVIGASGKGDRPLAECELHGATAIVVGNEGAGIGPEVLAECDELARIPLAVDVDSLNAAAATAILLYEVTRQRGGKG